MKVSEQGKSKKSYFKNKEVTFIIRKDGANHTLEFNGQVYDLSKADTLELAQIRLNIVQMLFGHTALFDLV